MKNITIKVAEEVAQWARVHAAKNGTSISRIVSEMLRERMEQEEGYSRAHERWQARATFEINEGGQPYPSRDEIHER